MGHRARQRGPAACSCCSYVVLLLWFGGLLVLCHFVAITLKWLREAVFQGFRSCVTSYFVLRTSYRSDARMSHGSVLALVARDASGSGGAARRAIRSRLVYGLRYARSGLNDSLGISRDAHDHRCIRCVLVIRRAVIRSRSCPVRHSGLALDRAAGSATRSETEENEPTGYASAPLLGPSGALGATMRSWPAVLSIPYRALESHATPSQGGGSLNDDPPINPDEDDAAGAPRRAGRPPGHRRTSSFAPADPALLRQGDALPLPFAPFIKGCFNNCVSR